jgi:hypothetical protein
LLKYLWIVPTAFASIEALGHTWMGSEISAVNISLPTYTFALIVFCLRLINLYETKEEEVPGDTTMKLHIHRVVKYVKIHTGQFVNIFMAATLTEKLIIKFPRHFALQPE